MINTTTMLAHIKGSVRDFLFQFQDENRTEMVQYGGEISWEVSSTITKDSLLLRFIPMVRFFTPYKLFTSTYLVATSGEKNFASR
jgi:hypothetical protein